jgi:hypothetical protein
MTITDKSSPSVKVSISALPAAAVSPLLRRLSDRSWKLIPVVVPMTAKRITKGETKPTAAAALSSIALPMTKPSMTEPITVMIFATKNDAIVTRSAFPVMETFFISLCQFIPYSPVKLYLMVMLVFNKIEALIFHEPELTAHGACSIMKMRKIGHTNGETNGITENRR